MSKESFPSNVKVCINCRHEVSVPSGLYTGVCMVTMTLERGQWWFLSVDEIHHSCGEFEYRDCECERRDISQSPEYCIGGGVTPESVIALMVADHNEYQRTIDSMNGPEDG